MSTQVPSWRSVKRYARDGNRRKAVLNVDLNAPAVEARVHEGTPVPTLSLASQSRAVPMETQQWPQPQPNDGLSSSPIDVEAIEDDVLILSSTRGFPQSRNRSRRRHPVTVVLDEDHEVDPRRTGVTVEDLVTSSLNNHSKRVRIPPGARVINCEVYSATEDNSNAERKKVVSPHSEPEKVIVKEAIFTCPVCLNQLAEACSTICGHIFCQDCIKTSIQAQKKCPTCRRKLNKNNFHRVYLPNT